VASAVGRLSVCVQTCVLHCAALPEKAVPVGVRMGPVAGMGAPRAPRWYRTPAADPSR